MSENESYGDIRTVTPRSTGPTSPSRGWRCRAGPTSARAPCRWTPAGRARPRRCVTRGSSPSALHLGPIDVALEAAALDELERVTGTTRRQVEQWTVLMVKPGYRGPFVARARVLGAGDRLGVDAAMTDDGHGGRTMATVSAAWRRDGHR